MRDSARVYWGRSESISVIFMMKIRFHTENCQKIFVFLQKIDIYPDSV